MKMVVFLVFLMGCSLPEIKRDRVQQFETHEEFENLVNIKDLNAPEDLKKKEKKQADKIQIEKRSEKKTSQGVKDELIKQDKSKSIEKTDIKRKEQEKKSKKVIKKDKVKKTQQITKKAALKRLPEIEDQEGFMGRRPLEDPFRAGEKAKLKVSYFGIPAGYLILEVLPFSEVNNQKSYHFQVSIQTLSAFNWIYTVDDRVETFLDFETLLPSTYTLKVKETSQIIDARTFFNWNKLQGTYWQNKYTKKKGEEKKKITWDFEPYSQNVFSAIFYMRVFQFTPNKELAFRVADYDKNVIFRGKVVRRETLKTSIGEIKTVVIQPQIEFDGIFEPVGDIFIWLTDDVRKIIVRIESKIKIGKLVAEIEELVLGDQGSNLDNHNPENLEKTVAK